MFNLVPFTRAGAENDKRLFPCRFHPRMFEALFFRVLDDNRLNRLNRRLS